MRGESEQLLEKILSENLSRAVAWIGYAEAKNLALLTFCSGWMVALFVFSTQADTPWSLFKLASWTALLPFTVGAMVGVYSFLPVTKPPSRQGDGDVESAANLLFFGNLASTDPATAGGQIKARYFATNGALRDELVEDVGAQAVFTSRIADRKFSLFNVAYEAVIAGFSVIGIFGVVVLIQAFANLP